MRDSGKYVEMSMPFHEYYTTTSPKLPKSVCFKRTTKFIFTSPFMSEFRVYITSITYDSLRQRDTHLP